jgi:hypothetical protein
MQHLNKLLQMENSNLAWVLRLGLYGLRTQLQQALKTSATEDSGRNICLELLKELDTLLEAAPQLESQQESVDGDELPTAPDNFVWEDVLEPITSELKLRNISETLLADRELSHYIGDYKFYSTTDGDLWNEMQRLLLRVPEKVANVWRERILAEANQLGAVEDKQSLLALPFSRYEYVYPGLTGKVKARGLCLSNQVGFDSQLILETRSEELDFLAGVVACYLKFIELDPFLHHALKSVDRFGVRSLNSESEKFKYITALVDRLQRVQATADGEPVVALRARLDLDEAIHSLIYLPCADRYSWWGKLQQEARRTLDTVVEKARHTGYHIQIRPLWGTYADVFTWSKDDLQLESGGIPGEVCACLRVYAKINDEALSGRLLFRAS